MPKAFKKYDGFTLLELMIVIAIMGILVTLAQPSFRTAVLKSKEAALKENLFNIRNVLDQYYADNGAYPNALNDLVDKGYMRAIPVDPFTGDNQWNLEFYAGGEDSKDEAGGIYDVHSASNLAGLNGVPYREW
jgi:general secretion pathway protein G